MSVINHLGDLKRMIEHVKVMGGEDNDRPRYEPAMFIYKEGMLGRSFCIPLSAGWKYLDPKDNTDASSWDRIEFDRLASRALFAMQLGTGDPMDAAAIVMAEKMHDNSGFLLTVAFGLVKCCQMLDITVSGASLAQLLMFVQNGLTELRTKPMHEAEDHVEIGEIEINLNGKKTHQALTVSETELAAGVN